MSLGGDLSRAGGSAVRSASAARLLWTRVVALLVFAVSPVVSARWSGRRWVGPVVVAVIAVEFFATLAGLLGIVSGYLPKVAIFFIGSALIAEILQLSLLLSNNTYLQRSTISLFIPGLRLASIGAKAAVFPLFTCMPVYLFLWGSRLRIAFSHSSVSWMVELLLVLFAFLSILGTYNLYCSKNRRLFALLFLMTSPYFLILHGYADRFSAVSIGGMSLILLLPVVHSALLGRIIPLCLDISLHRSVVLCDAKRYGEEPVLLHRIQSNILKRIIPLFGRLRDRPFYAAVLHHLIALTELVLGSFALSVIFFIVFLTWLILPSVDILSLIDLDPPMRIANSVSIYFVGFFLPAFVALIWMLPFTSRNSAISPIIGYAIGMNHSRDYRTRALMSALVVGVLSSLVVFGLSEFFISALPSPFNGEFSAFGLIIGAMTFFFVIMSVQESRLFGLRVLCCSVAVRVCSGPLGIVSSSEQSSVFLLALSMLRFLYLLRTLRRGDLAY